MSLRGSMAVVFFLLASLGAPIGCTPKREQAEQRQGTSGGSQVPLPSGSGLHSSPAAPSSTVVDTASSLDEIISRIHEHESTLSQIIAAGRLNEMGVEVSRIRELLTKAVTLAQVQPDQRTELEGHVSEAKRVAAALVEAGKAGSLEESKARNADLQRELGLVERMVVPHLSRARG